MDIKQHIADNIYFNFNELGINAKDLIIESISEDKGDYSLPCFAFAKIPAPFGLPFRVYVLLRFVRMRSKKRQVLLRHREQEMKFSVFSS